MSQRRVRVRVSASLLLIVLVAGACNPIFGDESGPVRHTTLTAPDGSRYAFIGDDDVVTATAPAPFPNGNVREFFWNTDHPYYADQESCVTWNDVSTKENGDITQPGLAMRIAPTGEDGTGIKGITINQNIYAHAYWVMWVNTWYAPPGTPANVAENTGIESFDLNSIVRETVPDGAGGTVRAYIPAPWYVCARTRGLQLTFKFWTHREPEPGWDDPTHVFETTLPEGWDHAGYSGGYIGHLLENRTATFSGFTTAPLCLVPDMVDTPECRAALNDVGASG